MILPLRLWVQRPVLILVAMRLLLRLLVVGSLPTVSLEEETRWDPFDTLPT